jgi:Helix-turn-helix domain
MIADRDPGGADRHSARLTDHQMPDGPASSPVSAGHRPENGRALARWALREDPKLSSAAKLAWLMLDTRGEDPHPSIATLAANCRVSRGTARRALRELEEAGWLRVAYRTTRAGDSDTNRYALICPVHEGVGPSKTPPPERPAQEGVGPPGIPPGGYRKYPPGGI